MTTRKPDFQINTLLSSYKNGSVINVNDLKVSFHNHYALTNEQDFQRYLYHLRKRSILVPTGKGLYIVQDPGEPSYKKKKFFVPTMPAKLIAARSQLVSALPFARFVVWESKVLHDYMVHQFDINMTIIKTEKEATGAAFNILEGIFPGAVYVRPKLDILDRYALKQREPIIIANLITRTPKGRRNDPFVYARLETILVDIFVEKELFAIYQGTDLVTIFEEVFRIFAIDERHLLWYANRRNAKDSLLRFIKEKTDINMQITGAIQ